MHVKLPIQKHCFFKGTPEAGFLVTQTLTGLTVLARAVNFAAPVQVLVMERMQPRGFPISQWVLFGGERKPICGKQKQQCNCRYADQKSVELGPGLWLQPYGFGNCCHKSARERKVEENRTRAKSFMILFFS